MRSVWIPSVAFGLSLAVTACEPTATVASGPAPRVAAATSDALGLDETRDLDDDVASPTIARAASVPDGRVALTADTDPSRLEGGTVSREAEATFACTIPGAPGPAFCARAVTGPFVVTDLQTSPGCGPHAFASAIGGKGAAARWTLSGPLGVHGARMLVAAGEALFVGAVAGAPPPDAAPPPAPAPKPRRAKGIAAPTEPAAPPSDARCMLTWNGFRPYAAGEPARGARTVERALGAPGKRPDVLEPTPPLGGAGAEPRRIYDRLDGAHPAAPSSARPRL